MLENLGNIASANNLMYYKHLQKAEKGNNLQKNG